VLLLYFLFLHPTFRPFSNSLRFSFFRLHFLFFYVFGTTFYFLESGQFSHYFYFLKSKIFGMYFYTVNHKKRDILFLSITLANLSRFL